MKKSVFFLLLVFFSICLFAQTIDKYSLCPVQRWIGDRTGAEFADTFNGDTITFSIPDANNSFFESFLLLYPDTIWLKKRPTNKPPQERKHYTLNKNFEGVPGWGVNAHRHYTCGSSLEGRYFVLRGSYTEDIPYLGKFDYVLLEDCSTGQIIKWDPSQYECNGIVIFSPSISRHLSLMKGNEFLYETSDSTYIPAKCTDVLYSVDIKNKKWNVHLNADFSTPKGRMTSTNWNPRYYLKKDSAKLNIEETNY